MLGLGTTIQLFPGGKTEPWQAVPLTTAAGQEAGRPLPTDALAEGGGPGAWDGPRAGVQEGVGTPNASPGLSHSVETQALAAYFQNLWGLPEPSVTHSQ